MTPFAKFLIFLTILAGLSTAAAYTGLDQRAVNSVLCMFAFAGYLIYPKEKGEG